MIKINEIKEPVCKLYDDADNLVGDINSALQLNDVRIQIKNQKAKGYYVMWKGRTIRIDSRGNLEEWPIGFYDNGDKQLDELIGLKEFKMSELRKQVYPMMYALSSTGKVQQWQITAEELEDGTANIITASGQVDGKIKIGKKHVKKGKNIGRSNETDPFQQANSEATSKLNVKQYANYERFLIDIRDYVPRVLLPQLAKGPKKGKIRFPCYMQPKLNGVCCIARRFNSPLCFKSFTKEYIEWATEKGLLKGVEEKDYRHGIAYHSRGGHLFHTLEHLTPMLAGILDFNEMVHGELYNHDWSLQKIGSYTKDLKEDAHKLEYWIYDYPTYLKLTWERREEILTNKVYKSLFPTIRLVPSVLVNSYEEAKHWHDKFVKQGFEGGMLRNSTGYYKFEFNSNDLEKVKEFEDAEFKIIGGKEGTGNDEGCIVFKCITPEGLEFDVRPKGTVEKRQYMFSNLNKYLGENLTVRFAEYSDDKIPLQPVGVAVRDYE